MASSRWQARNERARRLGYRNYYDYRIHNYGQEAATEPPPRGETLRRRRGHAGGADFWRIDPDAIRALLSLDFERDEAGRIIEIDTLVVTDEQMDLHFRLRKRDLDPDRIAALIDALRPGTPIGRAFIYLLRDADDVLIDEAA